MLGLKHLCIPLLLTVLLAASGCESTRVSDKSIDPISRNRLQDLMNDRRAGLLLIDSRTREAYDAGHIAGALHLLLSDAQMHDARLKEARQIVVYGRDPQDDIPRVLAKRLMMMGYSNVTIYPGGYHDWQRHTLAQP
jgi:rhodanese-related sulfurtransferase